MSGNKVFKITRKTRKRKICTFTFARLSKHCTKFANVELDKGEEGEVRHRGKGRVIGRRRGEIKIYKVKGG